MSRVAYAALGKRGSFSRDNRYTKIQEDAPPPVAEDAGEKAYRAGYEDGQISAHADFEARLKAERAARTAIELAFARFDAASERQLRERMLAVAAGLDAAAANEPVPAYLPREREVRMDLARKDEGA